MQCFPEKSAQTHGVCGIPCLFLGWVVKVHARSPRKHGAHIITKAVLCSSVPTDSSCCCFWFIYNLPSPGHGVTPKKASLTEFPTSPSRWGGRAGGRKVRVPLWPTHRPGSFAASGRRGFRPRSVVAGPSARAPFGRRPAPGQSAPALAASGGPAAACPHPPRSPLPG